MSNRYLSNRYRNAVSTPMAEAAALAGSYGDIINLSLGDPDLITDRAIINEALKDAMKGHTRYTHPLGDPELRDEIISYYKLTHGCSVGANEVMAVVGACHGMYLALEAILDDGDEVIVPEPYFTPYAHQIKLARGRMVTLETREEEGFQINMERLKALITDRTKAIIINTPNNPTGACYSRETLLALAETAIAEDLLILSDDVYGAFSFNEAVTPIIAIPGMKERTIIIGSFSKDYAMTGWRIGYVIAPDYLIACISDINEGVCYSAPSVSQRAAIHALRLKASVQPGIVHEYKKRVFHAYEQIGQIGWMSVLPPQGSFYLFVNVKKAGMTSSEISRKILEDAHVLVVPGNAFGSSGEGYIRIACTLKNNKLEEAFNRIKAMNI